jgi:hypothetical protein
MLRLLLILAITMVLGGCSSARFLQFKEPQLHIRHALGYAKLPDLESLSLGALHSHCLNVSDDSDIGLVLSLQCAETLLASPQLNPNLKAYALNLYNDALYKLLKTNNSQSSLVSVAINGPKQFTFVSSLQAVEPRLAAKTFGELGLALVVKQQAPEVNKAKFYPAEGIYRAYNAKLASIAAQGLTYLVTIDIEPLNSSKEVRFGDNHYALSYSPAASFLMLLEVATIDQFSWLGFISASEAEKRRGIFSLVPLTADKEPLVMIHGLNSDPLIWRYLTMAILNDELLSQRYQIWHVYYPSGPPPFFNAMRVRKLLNELSKVASGEQRFTQATIIGHSMGGVISKTLTTQSQYTLWDATFTERPEQLLNNQQRDIQDIFVFAPVFEHNRVFFLDTPHRGSSIAESALGYIGASLVTLPLEFTGLFKALIDEIGIAKLTKGMLPFLKDYGPNSVQVLRPGHPLMTVLCELPVQGEAYNIIGSTGRLSCEPGDDCSDISDSVVDYSSAYYDKAKETIIVKSSHNSFQSPRAIEYILAKLKQHK